MLLDLPLEILHLIFFDLWILDHRDIAAVRGVCRQLRGAVLAKCLDLRKWEARAGPEWCMEINHPRSLLECYARGSPYPPEAGSNYAIAWASNYGHIELGRGLLPRVGSADGARELYGNIAWGQPLPGAALAERGWTAYRLSPVLS